MLLQLAQFERAQQSGGIYFIN